MTDLLMKRLADFIIKRRLLVLTIIALITTFFAYQCIHLTLVTNFNDLLPQTHPYVKIHNKFRETFGGANFLVIMVSVKEGDIFNQKTLEKVRYITNELEGIPGIDRYKILSIASRKLKNPKITSWGLEAVPLMWPEVPKNDQEMEILKDAIYSNEAYYGFYVSLDSKKCLIFADFFEEELNYNIVYRELERIRSKTEDENTIVRRTSYAPWSGSKYDQDGELYHGWYCHCDSHPPLSGLPLHLGNVFGPFLWCGFWNMGIRIYGTYGLQS